MSTIGQEDLEALGKLKATNEIVNISLHADLMFLQHAYNEVLTDVELQKQEPAGYQEKVLPQSEGAEARTEATGESVVEQARKMREVSSQNAATQGLASSSSPKKRVFNFGYQSLYKSRHSKSQMAFPNFRLISHEYLHQLRGSHNTFLLHATTMYLR